jgi:L-asparagine transporter-like permease
MNLRDKFKDRWRWTGLTMSTIALMSFIMFFVLFPKHVTIIGFVVFTAVWALIPYATAKIRQSNDLEINKLGTNEHATNEIKYFLLLLLAPLLILSTIWLTPDDPNPIKSSIFGIFMGTGIYFLIFGRGPSPQKSQKTLDDTH